MALIHIAEIKRDLKQLDKDFKEYQETWLNMQVRKDLQLILKKNHSSLKDVESFFCVGLGSPSGYIKYKLVMFQLVCFIDLPNMLECGNNPKMYIQDPSLNDVDKTFFRNHGVKISDMSKSENVWTLMDAKSFLFYAPGHFQVHAPIGLFYKQEVMESLREKNRAMLGRLLIGKEEEEGQLERAEPSPGDQSYGPKYERPMPAVVICQSLSDDVDKAASPVLEYCDAYDFPQNDSGPYRDLFVYIRR